MTLVVAGISRACGGAFAGIVDPGEVFDADVRVLAGGIDRGVDGTAEFGRAIKSSVRGWRVILLVS